MAWKICYTCGETLVVNSYDGCMSCKAKLNDEMIQ